jgi:hypothetical protein
MSRKPVLRHILAPSRPFVAFAFSLASARAAAAAPNSFELQWIAPEGCPTDADIRASVAELLHREPAPSADALHVAARVEERSEGNWQCVVETRIGSRVGRRTIEVESCTAAAESTALIVALILDPEAGSRAVPPRAASTPAAAKRKQSTRDAPSRARGVGLSLGPLVGLDVGTLPAPTYGLGAVGGTQLGSSSFEIGLALWKAQRGGVPDLTPEAGGSVGLIAGFVGICPALPIGRIDVGGCLAAELGRFQAEGFGVDESVTAGSRWIAVAAGPLARARFTKVVSLSLRTALFLPLDRPSFVVDVSGSAREFHQPNPVVGRALLSLDFRLGP